MKAAVSLWPLACLWLSAAHGESWHQEPFMIKAGGRPLDTGTQPGGYFEAGDGESSDRGGHAAPFLVDVDGDGRRDLVIGSFSGRFRWHRNSGTDSAPVFEQTFAWLRAGGEIAAVPIYCCVASGPQFFDIDGDGILDLTAGSYDPGAIYWFKGEGGGHFNQRHLLVNSFGNPVYAHPQSVYTSDPEDGGRNKSFMSNVSWTDWDEDGKPDLLFGNFWGELFIARNRGRGRGQITPLATQPVFGQPTPIQINGQNAIPEHHCAPVAADWDGDGLWDILIGAESGAVYWLRNSGKRGAPVFTSREKLLEAGVGAYQWMDARRVFKRGSRAQIQVVDYNRDGALDLLVGDWSSTVTPRSDLTAREREALQSLKEQLANLDQQVGYAAIGQRLSDNRYQENRLMLEQAMKIEREMARYLVEWTSQEGRRTVAYHGHVWVYLSLGHHGRRG